MLIHCVEKSARWLGWAPSRYTAVLSLYALCSGAQAVDVGLAGVFPGKALLTIDGGGAANCCGWQQDR
jgi:hypothetical protein